MAESRSMRCRCRGNARASGSAPAVLRGHRPPCDDIRLRRVGASVRERPAPGRPARTQAPPGEIASVVAQPGGGAKAPPVGASSTVEANRAGPRASCPLNQGVKASPPSPSPASGGVTFMPIKSIASGGGTPPERAPPPCKRSGLSGGPASSHNVVPAFTLPPGSPLSIAHPLPLKQEAPSPIGAPRAAPTSIPSRCAHRTLSPKRLRRPTPWRSPAGRRAARSAAQVHRRVQRLVGPLATPCGFVPADVIASGDAEVLVYGEPAGQVLRN